MDIIDTTYDVRTDADGEDPDTHSATLRRYHRLLWSKPLPSGAMFDLVERGAYLYHQSGLGKFCLSSDSVMQTFIRWTSMREITSQCTEMEKDPFFTLGYTIGGMLIFPANQIHGKQTINQAKGFNRAIADRMDLTLECIRRHYSGGSSPLAETLVAYDDFFELFENFHGYVEHFLLQDLVTGDYQGVRFFTRFDTPSDKFPSPAVPRDVDKYREFRRKSIDFIKARNQRIAQTSTTNRSSNSQ